MSYQANLYHHTTNSVEKFLSHFLSNLFHAQTYSKRQFSSGQLPDISERFFSDFCSILHKKHTESFKTNYQLDPLIRVNNVELNWTYDLAIVLIETRNLSCIDLSLLRLRSTIQDKILKFLVLPVSMK